MMFKFKYSLEHDVMNGQTVEVKAATMQDAIRLAAQKLGVDRNNLMFVKNTEVVTDIELMVMSIYRHN